MGRRLGIGAVVLAGAAAALGMAGCTAAVSNALDAPIQVISATDVAVGTSIQAVAQAAQAHLLVGGSFLGFGPASAAGTNITSGPSGSSGEISYSVTPGGGALVMTGWNRADRHCVGELYVQTALPTPVLGITSAGQYYFVAPAASSSACDAASYAATTAAPTGWPKNPSSSVWSVT